APPGSRLAGIENHGVRVFDRRNELSRERGYSREPLDEVERETLGGQQRASGPGNFQQWFINLDVAAVFSMALEVDRRRKFCTDGFGNAQPGEDERLTWPHYGFRTGTLRHRSQGGDVPA